MHADALLGRGGGAVAVELALPDLQQRGIHVIDPVIGEQPGTPACQQRDLLREADAEGIRLVVRDPGDVAVRGLAASSIRSVLSAAATLATSTASAAAAASAVKSTAAAKPQVPSTITRTARPTSSVSKRVSRCPSDSPICWPLMRSARKSACSAPRAPARLRPVRGADTR